MSTRITTAAIVTAALVSIPTTASAAQNHYSGHRGQQTALRGQQQRASSVGALSAQQVDTLQAMAEEEKLAHDVYATAAQRYPGVFDRIAASEARHLNAVRTLMTRYAVTDPTSGLPVGDFASPQVERLFDNLTAVDTYQQAMAVGADIERMDIADLKDAFVTADEGEGFR